MNENRNILYAIQTLGEILEDRDTTIRAKKFRIETLEGELEAAKRMAKRASEEAAEERVKMLEAYVEDLEAKVEELQERIAVMTEADAPAPTWEITSPEEVREGEGA